MRARIFCLVLALLPVAAIADDGPVGISELFTPELRLYYPAPLAFLAPYAVRTFTNSVAWQRRMFGWTPSEPLTIQLQDFSDYGNATTYAAPRGWVAFDVSPLSHAFETYPASERMYTLMNHELLHVVQDDVANDEDRRWRRFFAGKVPPQANNPETLLYSYLTTPRFNTPRWVLEGTAVFFETWMSGGLGRAQGGYDEMVFRAMVRDGAHFYDSLGLASKAINVDFQAGANNYLYGTRFVTWLAYAYSPEKVVEWLKRDETSRRYYSDQFEHVFGVPLDTAWDRWVTFEHEFQARNLAEVRKFPITPERRLAGSPVGSVSRTYYDEAAGTLYAGYRTAGALDYIGALDTRSGEMKPIVEIKRSMPYRVTSFAFDPATATAFYTNDNRGFLSFRDLVAVDVHTGVQRTLIENGRIGEIVFNPADRALLGVRHDSGIATLVRIPPPYDTWYQVQRFPYGVVPYDLDVTRDGRLLSASVAEVNGDQFLRVWELPRLLAGDSAPSAQFRFGQSVPESFTFGRDGRYLYGSSYYTGVSNIFRCDVLTGSIEAVTNAETGFFRPVPLEDGRLLVLTYTGDGFVPAIIDPRPTNDLSAITFLGAEVASRHPVVKTWQVAAPGTVDDEKLVTHRGEYVPWRSLALANAYPVIEGYKSATGFGYHANIDDPLQFINVGVTAAYTPTGSLPASERAHVDITGRYRFWRGELAYNKSDFYDLFGPTKRSRKGYAAKLGYDDFLVFDEPRRLLLSYDLAYYDRIDTLPGAQNVGTPFSRLLTAEVGLHYTDARRSIGAVDDEKGVAWEVVVKGNKVRDEYPTLVRGGFDYGIPLPLAHSSIWLRSAAGIGTGRPDDPVANFYFGGFGNNYVDRLSVKRYRDYSSMPGFDLDEIGGLNFARQMIEWNLPPVIFESVGTPAFYLNWLRPAVFATGLWTDVTSAARRQNYQSVGTQVDLRFSVLHWSEMTLSVGYALGFRDAHRASSEWMVSLKIF